MSSRILMVDDEEAIRVMLQQFLVSRGYETDTAADGVAALDMLGMKPYDMVLSDINMPRMKGFELLQKVRESYPHIKRVLITAYDVDEYLRLAMRHDVGNIIAKTTPFNFDEIEMVVRNLLNEDFFGLQRYLHENCVVSQVLITNHDQIEKTTQKIAEIVPGEKKARKMSLVLNEILTNAVYYGACGERNTDKTLWRTTFELPAEKAVHVFWASDSDKFAFSIVDNVGRLKKRDVLHWLCRQTEKDARGIPKGVFDSHGRGFFIARNYVDSLIINIQTGSRTEVIGLTYHNRNTGKHKPLYINEV